MQNSEAAHKNILITLLERSSVDSILLDIGTEPKQVIKIYAHDNPQNYWSIPVTASHSASDVCRIIAHKLGSDLKYQLSEECSGREKFLDGHELILNIMNKRRKNKKYQFIIRPATSNKCGPASPALDPKPSNSLMGTEEVNFVRVYYHLNPATYWTIPLNVTLTCGDLCAHIAAKLQLPEKESCHIYLVDDSRIHSGAVAPTPVTQDQNIKGLLVQHRNTSARLVVAFKQLAEGIIIPPLAKDSIEIPRRALTHSLQPSSPTITWHESPPSTHYTRLFDTKTSSPENIPVYTLPPTITSSPPPANPISSINAPSFTFSLSPSPIKSTSPSSTAPTGKRETQQQLQSSAPSNTSPKADRISFLDQLRHDLKEENKALDKRHKSHDDSWLDIPGYYPKPPSPSPERSPSPDPDRTGPSPKSSPTRRSPRPNRKGFGSGRSPSSRATTPSRLNREPSPIPPREDEEGLEVELCYEVHPIEQSNVTLREDLDSVSRLDELSREQFREEVVGYEQKLKEAFAAVTMK